MSSLKHLIEPRETDVLHNVSDDGKFNMLQPGETLYRIRDFDPDPHGNRRDKIINGEDGRTGDFADGRVVAYKIAVRMDITESGPDGLRAYVRYFLGGEHVEVWHGDIYADPETAFEYVATASGWTQVVKETRFGGFGNCTFTSRDAAECFLDMIRAHRKEFVTAQHTAAQEKKIAEAKALLESVEGGKQ